MATATALAADKPIGFGFPDPVRDSQTVFRIVLDVMANPGRIAPLPALVTAQDRLGPGAAAICLALVDFETPLWLDPILASDDTAGYLRFHAGAPIAASPNAAGFAVLEGASTPLGSFKTGSDAYPEEGATVIIQVPDLFTTGPLVLSGPGIDGERCLGVEGLPASFWEERAAVNAGFPRGIDLILCAGHRVAALPRTTKAQARTREGIR